MSRDVGSSSDWIRVIVVAVDSLWTRCCHCTLLLVWNICYRPQQNQVNAVETVLWQFLNEAAFRGLGDTLHLLCVDALLTSRRNVLNTLVK